MAEVLTPSLECLRGLAESLAKLNKCISKAMWVEIGQAGTFKRITKDCANRRGIAPIFSRQSHSLKLVRFPQCDTGCRKQRIVRSFESWEVLREVPGETVVVTDARNPLTRLSLPVAEEFRRVLRALYPLEFWLD